MYFAPVVTTTYRMKNNKSLTRGLCLEMSGLARARAQLLKCSILVYNWAYHMDKISRRLFYKYRNWYHVWVELSGWTGSVSHGLGADLSLPPCLSVTIGIWTLAHKSDPRAEISGEIVRYDALAPRPEVLLSWCFVCACAGPSYCSSYHIRGNKMNCIGSSEYMTVFTSFTRASFLNMWADQSPSLLIRTSFPKLTIL